MGRRPNPFREAGQPVHPVPAGGPGPLHSTANPLLHVRGSSLMGEPIGCPKDGRDLKVKVDRPEPTELAGLPGCLTERLTYRSMDQNRDNQARSRFGSSEEPEWSAGAASGGRHTLLAVTGPGPGSPVRGAGAERAWDRFRTMEGLGSLLQPSHSAPACPCGMPLRSQGRARGRCGDVGQHRYCPSCKTVFPWARC